MKIRTLLFILIILLFSNSIVFSQSIGYLGEEQVFVVKYDQKCNMPGNCMEMEVNSGQEGTDYIIESDILDPLNDDTHFITVIFLTPGDYTITFNFTTLFCTIGCGEVVFTRTIISCYEDITIDSEITENYSYGPAEHIYLVPGFKFSSLNNISLELKSGLCDNKSFPQTKKPAKNDGKNKNIFINEQDIQKEKNTEYLDNNYLFEIYPNPSTGIINVEIADYHYFNKLEVFNITGKVLISKNNLKQHNQLDISAFNKGVYFVRIFSSDKIKTKKLILK